MRALFVPPELAWTPGQSHLRSLVEGLAGTRVGLLRRPAAELADVLGAAGERFLDPHDSLRRTALAELPASSGLSPAMASAVLDGMASDWTAPRLHELLAAEFPEGPALDGFVPGRRDAVRAVGRPVTIQVVAGSVPGVGATALLRSLLVKSPTLVKAGQGDQVLPALLARAIHEADPELGSAAAVLYWPGGRADLLGELMDAAAAGPATVVAYGGDPAVQRIRDASPVTARFVGYHHRIGYGVVGREALTPERVRETAAAVAGAVSFFDQRGCVCPQGVFVERGGAVSPESFVDAVADALEALESSLPAGSWGAEEASAVQQLRGTAELLAASEGGVRVRHGGTSSWTVVLDPQGEMDRACAGRSVRLIPVGDVTDIPEVLAPLAGHLQSVGFAGCGERLGPLANRLAEVGVTRVTPLERMPFPPPWWHHDGQGPLRALVDWTDLDLED